MTLPNTGHIFDVLKEEYSIDDFKSMFQQALYKKYKVVFIDSVTEWDSTATYNKDDMVYTKKFGIYTLYLSLLDNNTEPLANTAAWKETEMSIITDTELESLLSLCWDIIPASGKKVVIDLTKSANLNKLKYIIGLFVACYIANKYSTTFKNGGRQTQGMGIDGVYENFAVPQYALEQNNIFYVGNPFGMEILSLFGKFFTKDFNLADYNIKTYSVDVINDFPSI